MAEGPMGAERRTGNSTPWTPHASALRSSVPTFWGSSSESSTSTKGGLAALPGPGHDVVQGGPSAGLHDERDALVAVEPGERRSGCRPRPPRPGSEAPSRAAPAGRAPHAARAPPAGVGWAGGPRMPPPPAGVRPRAPRHRRCAPEARAPRRHPGCQPASASGRAARRPWWRSTRPWCCPGSPGSVVPGGPNATTLVAASAGRGARERHRPAPRRGRSPGRGPYPGRGGDGGRAAGPSGPTPAALAGGPPGAPVGRRSVVAAGTRRPATVVARTARGRRAAWAAGGRRSARTAGGTRAARTAGRAAWAGLHGSHPAEGLAGPDAGRTVVSRASDRVHDPHPDEDRLDAAARQVWPSVCSIRFHSCPSRVSSTTMPSPASWSRSESARAQSFVAVPGHARRGATRPPPTVRHRPRRRPAP